MKYLLSAVLGVVSIMAPFAASAQQLYTYSSNSKNVWTPNGWAYPNANYSYTTTPPPTQQTYPAQPVAQQPYYPQPVVQPYYTYSQQPMPQPYYPPQQPSYFPSYPSISIAGTPSYGYSASLAPQVFAGLGTYNQLTPVQQALFQQLSGTTTYDPCCGVASPNAYPASTYYPSYQTPQALSINALSPLNPVFTTPYAPLTVGQYAYPNISTQISSPLPSISSFSSDIPLLGVQYPTQASPYRYMYVVQTSSSSVHPGQSVYSVGCYDRDTSQNIYSYTSSTPIYPADSQVYDLPSSDGYYYFGN